MVLSTQWLNMKVFRSPYDFPKVLSSQIQVTNFEAGLILTTLYVFPSNFSHNKATRMVQVPIVLLFSMLLKLNLNSITITTV